MGERADIYPCRDPLATVRPKKAACRDGSTTVIIRHGVGAYVSCAKALKLASVDDLEIRILSVF
jgi:hypothetical protein